MTKTERFLMLVQTAVIIESIAGEPSSNTVSGKATEVLNIAMRIPEHLLPDDVEAACDSLIETLFYRKEPKPDWLVTAISGGNNPVFPSLTSQTASSPAE